jgi:Rieske Fe-S protein
MAFSIRLESIGAFGVPTVYSKSDDRFDMSFVVRVQTAIRASVEDPKSGGYLVGYSPICTHMGCRLVRGPDDHNVIYNSNGQEQLTCGPCPCHGTTFDLLRQGLVVLGPATQNLAQLKLDLSQANS